MAPQVLPWLALYVACGSIAGTAQPDTMDPLAEALADDPALEGRDTKNPTPVEEEPREALNPSSPISVYADKGPRSADRIVPTQLAMLKTRTRVPVPKLGLDCRQTAIDAELSHSEGKDSISRSKSFVFPDKDSPTGGDAKNQHRASAGGAGRARGRKGRGKGRKATPNSVFTAPLRIRKDKKGRLRTEVLVVKPAWVEKNRWQLPGGARAPGEPATFECAGSRILRDEVGKSPRGFKVWGERTWWNSWGKKGLHATIVWGEFDVDAADRDQALDWEGKPHELQWIPVPHKAHQYGTEKDDRKPSRRNPVYRARGSNGKFLAVRPEVAKFFEFFNRSLSEDDDWPILTSSEDEV